MAFEKYNLRDNAFATLDAGIGASTTTITLTLGEGARFPTSNTILTLVQYNTLGDPTSGVLKREKVLMTSRSSDILTVTRGFDGDTPTSFQAGDYIYLNVVSEVIEDIQNEVTRLETDKLDKVGATRIGLTPYRLIYIDSTGAEIQLALGTAGQVLISQGATSNPIWQAPSVDIAGLTEETVGDMEADYFVKSDGVTNEKVLVSRYRASDAEAIAGTDNKKFISAKQARDNYFGFSKGVPSNNVKGASDAEVSTNLTSYQLAKQIQINNDARGIIRVSFEMRGSDTISTTAYGRVYLNGAPYGTEFSSSTNTYATYTQDLSYKPGDIFELYIRGSAGTCFVRNFRLSFDIERVGYTQVIL